MTEHEREQEPGPGPVGDQHEDGVVIEPDGELDRDLEQHGLDPEEADPERTRSEQSAEEQGTA